MAEDFDKQIVPIEQEKKDSSNPSFFSLLNPFRKKKESNDLLEFTKNFASLTKDGVPIVTSLETLESKVENKRFKTIISNSIEKVKAGIPLNECLREHSYIFNELYCDLIKIGEESGRLDQVLVRLSKLLESCLVIDRNVFEAIEFPTRVSIYAFCEILFLMVLVVPRFSILYEGYKIPLMTQIALKAGFWFQDHVMIILSVVASIVVIFFLMRLFKTGRYITDYLKLKIPIFGTLLKKHLLIHYSRNLVTLFNSGVSFISAMKKTNETMKNTYLKSVLEKIVRDIESGEPIALSFEKTKIMPKKSMNIIENGEESGYIDEMFTELADTYEKDSTNLAREIGIFVKPVYVVIMGTICGFLILSLFIPLFSIIKAVVPHP
ncbi:MAG: type II secretion system F family protein [Candidatus Riflebacteria bacterium]|nr:type II secretion system F family protein [Candidatus Riflebacteria bacterium]